jgi:hypothetical protein
VLVVWSGFWADICLYFCFGFALLGFASIWLLLRLCIAWKAWKGWDGMAAYLHFSLRRAVFCEFFSGFVLDTSSSVSVIDISHLSTLPKKYSVEISHHFEPTPSLSFPFVFSLLFSRKQKVAKCALFYTV